jgi:mannose-1-phosphate guanylyltransferase/mannose-6-phosphate isomerase
MTSIVSKPWGSYQVIEEGEKYRIKRIIVNPGGKLSLQSHQYRAEHWVVVKGKAEVIIEEVVSVLHSGEYIFVPLRAKHRLANNYSEDLVVIEVWYGDNLDEEDIIRYEDIYKRQ